MGGVIAINCPLIRQVDETVHLPDFSQIKSSVFSDRVAHDR